MAAAGSDDYLDTSPKLILYCTLYSFHNIVLSCPYRLRYPLLRNLGAKATMSHERRPTPTTTLNQIERHIFTSIHTGCQSSTPIYGSPMAIIRSLPSLAVSCRLLPSAACHLLPSLAISCHLLPRLATPCHALPRLAIGTSIVPCREQSCHALHGGKFKL